MSRPCKHNGCPNESYSRWHSGWEKMIYSTECKTCTSLLKKYDIHNGQRLEMMEEQQGKCAICYSEVQFQQGKGLSQEGATVDHDHTTGKVRGILCGSCNNLLGRAQDNTELLSNAIAYLERNANEV